MAKTELSIDETYCDGWGLFEGVREFAQNGRDAMRAGHSFDMVYNENKSILTLITKGTTLSHKSLLLGNSTKRQTPGMLGYWGEGYKIGSLALLRIGKRIRIRTGAELWEPEISRSKKFESNVLVFDITGNKTHRNEIVVEILNITPSEWESLKTKFLFLGEHSYDVTTSKYGNVLINAEGIIYVDGIYVCNVDLKHGYDFTTHEIKLDRDRRLVDAWEYKKATARIWESLYLDGKHENLVDGMLAADADDIQHFRHDWIVSSKLHEKIGQQFIAKHGQDTIPAQSMDEIRGLNLYGKRGEIVSSATLREIVWKQVGSPESIKMLNRDMISQQHGIETLSEVAHRNLLMATKMVSEATGFLLPYNIVTFADPKFVGMFKDGTMSISINVLESFEETLKTFVEEVGHTFGADGTREFQESMHTIYCDMLMINMGLKSPQIPANTVQ